MSDIKELSTEELLNTVGQVTEVSPTFHGEHRNLIEFIQEYKIIDGEIKVPNYVIYHEYHKIWRPQGTKLSKIDFFRKFNKHFRSKRTTLKRCYLLKSGTFDISEGNDEKAKKFDTRYTKRTKEKQKIKKEVPSIEPKV